MPIDYKRVAMDDLRAYPALKAAMENIRDKLAALNARAEGLSAQAADRVPVQGGGNQQEQRMLDMIVERERLKLNYQADKKCVGIIERGLSALSEEERLILTEFARVNRGGEKYLADRLSGEMGMDRSTVYRIRNDALRRYTLCCYGLTEL